MQTTQPADTPKPENHADIVDRRGDVVRKVLTSESFIEKFTLLCITVILSGLIVPLIINQLASLSSERQKALDAIKAKEEVILQSQSKLVADLAETMLTCETLALDVSWYKTGAALNDQMHEKAFARYSERIVDLISRWRALSSRAQTLASDSIAQKVDNFQRCFFKEQDTPINQLYIRKGSVEQWEAQHEKSEEMLAQARGLVSEITRDLRLDRANLTQNSAISSPSPSGAAAGLIGPANAGVTLSQKAQFDCLPPAR